MKHKAVTNLKTMTCLSAGALVLAAIEQAQAQYTPPPPPAPFQGFINQYLSSINGYTNHWNIGGEDRERYVAYEGYGISGKAGSVDFRDHGVSVDNQYLLTRIRFHLGYTDNWWSGYVEGQSSLADGDHRAAYADVPAIPGTSKTIGYGPESDTIDLHQAYFTVGDVKEFPLLLKVGRQELIYGDERLVGAFGWNNIGRSFDEAKLQWQNEYFNVDFFTGMPVVPRDGQFDMPNNQEWFSGAYATFTKIPDAILETYFLARNVSRTAISFMSDPDFVQPTARDVYTVGGRLKSKPGEIGNYDYTIDGAYQFGDFATTATGPRLDAECVHVHGAGVDIRLPIGGPNRGWPWNMITVPAMAIRMTSRTARLIIYTRRTISFTVRWIYSPCKISRIWGQTSRSSRLSRMSVALMGNVFWLANTSDYLYSVNGGPRTTGGYSIHPELQPVCGHRRSRPSRAMRSPSSRRWRPVTDIFSAAITSRKARRSMAVRAMPIGFTSRPHVEF